MLKSLRKSVSLMRMLTDSRLDADASARRWPDTAAAGYIRAEQPATDREPGFKATDIVTQDPVDEPNANLIVTRAVPHYKADHVDQIIQPCPPLVLTKRLEARHHPAIWVMPAEEPHDKIATRRHVSLQD